MSYGIPVVATATGGTPELLVPGTGLMVPSADPTALADALQTLLRDGKLRERSEEHTSELQSHLNLVCRLLLEKKKKKIVYIIVYSMLSVHAYSCYSLSP